MRKMEHLFWCALVLSIYIGSKGFVLSYPYQYDQRTPGIGNFNGNSNLKGNYGLNANAITAPGQTFSGDKYLPPSSASSTAPPIITKQFYMVSAEEDREDVTKKHFILGRPQKNYRVVFIKAPAAESVKLSAEYAPQEEKTVIYVLSKKANEVELEDLTTPATEASKPDIFFIKYKTPEEADAAQKEIQDQYDQLGGANEFIDKGIVPVKSVIGSFNTNGNSNNIAANGGYEYKKNGGWDHSNVENVLQRMRFYFK